MSFVVEAVSNFAANVSSGAGHEVATAAPWFRFKFQLYDKYGNLKDEWEQDNVVTVEGRNSLLNVYFRGTSQITTWYLGLISSVGWSAVSANDTAAQINGTNGWKECSDTHAPNYDVPAGTARAEITFNAPSGATMSSASTIDFTFMESGTVKGAFISSNGTRKNTTGVLYSAAAITPDKVVDDDDQLRVSVSLQFTVS